MKPTILFISLILTVSYLSPLTAAEKHLPGGCLQVPGEEGRTLPLLHTDVKAQIDGILAHTTLKQQFRNDTSNTLELTYIFPMPHRAAIGSYQFTIGERTIVGTIQTREKARQIYNQAREQGKTAALLEQQRPNVFTQSLTNVPAGAIIEVEISYDEVVRTEDGQMEWVFPMVVGPRFMPEDASSAGFKNPVYDTRNKNTISLQVELANKQLGSVSSASHPVLIAREASKVTVLLDKDQAIPNKDFALYFSYVNEQPDLIFANHYEGQNKEGNAFLLTLLPPNPQSLEGQVLPREFFFIIDVSGSMDGQPLNQAIATAKACMGSLRPEDTFQIMTFAGSTSFFKPEPVHPTVSHLKEAMSFLNSRRSGGGTYMMQAIEKALGAPKDPERYRMAVMFTDGYIGNEREIIAGIKKLKDHSRLFAFGIGSSVNHYLLEAMGRAGNGFTEIVSLNTDLNQIAKKWENRLRSPVLTDISIEFKGVDVKDVFPTQIADLFAGEPILISGRFAKRGSLNVTLKGKQGVETIKVQTECRLKQMTHDAVPRIWAREQIRDLNFMLTNPNMGDEKAGIEQKIRELGLNYRLLTAYTSFVAVDSESQVETEGRVHSDVAVPLPEGVSQNMIGLNQSYKACRMDSRKSDGLIMSLEAEEPLGEVSSLSPAVKPFEKSDVHKRLKPNGISADKSKKIQVQKLLYETGKREPVGLALLILEPKTVKTLTLVNTQTGKKLTLKLSSLKQQNDRIYHLLFKEINGLSAGTWTLKLPGGSEYQFTI